MKIILNHDIYSIKNGFAVHSPEIGLTAHGISPEIAKRNLEKTAVMFLRPFQREGTLEDTINRMKIKVDENDARNSDIIATLE